MLFSEFFTVALIPTLINTNPQHTPENLNHNNRAALNSRQLEHSSSPQDGSDFEDEFFKTGNSALVESRPVITDPVLLDIYEEEKRLDLGGGDYDMRSDEARELIGFQRRKLNRQREELSRFTASNTLPKGRSLDFESPSTDLLHNSGLEAGSLRGASPETKTEHPIVVPSTGEHQENTTKKPSTGFLGIGSFFNTVTTGIEKAANKIPIPSWKRSSSTSSPAPVPPTLETVLPSAPTNTPNVFSTDNVGILHRSLNLNCTEFQTTFKGECHNVLQNKECPAGQWLIEEDETKMGKCVPNKCSHLPNQAFFDGKCIKPYEEAGGHCHKGMKPLIFKNGDVECDCKDQHLYYHKDGNCYPAYTQGPCETRELLVSKVTQNGATAATCVKNKCSKDDYFCNAPSCPKDRNCIQLNTACKITVDRKEKEGKWGIHPDSLSPACIPLDFDADRPGKLIGNVPTLACAPGSRRDILGTCRKPSKMTFS